MNQLALSIRKINEGSTEFDACAADQDKFWEMHDSLFAEQDLISSTHLPQIATSLGVEYGSLDQAMLPR